MKEIIKKFIPPFLLDLYHFILAFFGALIYRFPSRELKVIGVTGTNGKTTVVEMISKIFEGAGYKVALANSIRFKIGEKEWPNTLRMTMPGRFKLQKFLREAVNSGCQYAILEVTSEGIKQYRQKFIKFDVAVFTNLAPEHIEAHGSFEKYREAKGKLFRVTKNIHIINIDDKNANYFLKFLAREKFLYQIEDGELKIKFSTQNVCAPLKVPKIDLKLLGDFNFYNALAAICVGLSQKIDLRTCKIALEKIKDLPGRMELVIEKPFKVFVDYAFTPNALEKVYQTLQRTKNKEQRTKMICVLGACGGGRDKWKRPVLGELAAKYCDETIITNEDPYDENPWEIIEQVAGGAFEEIRLNPRKSASIYKILDRREAIRKSLGLAKPGDIIIITGKGCEPSICLAKGKKISWDDGQVVREEFRKLKVQN